MKQASELNTKDAALAERNEQIVAIKAANARLERQVEMHILNGIYFICIFVLTTPMIIHCNSNTNYINWLVNNSSKEAPNIIWNNKLEKRVITNTIL